MRFVAAGLAALLLGAAFWFGWFARDKAAPPAAPAAQAPVPQDEPFWGKVRTFTAISPRTIEAKLRLLNTGNATDVGECLLIAYDRSGAVATTKVTTRGPADPGFPVFVTRRIKLGEPEAEKIQRFEVDC